MSHIAAASGSLFDPEAVEAFLTRPLRSTVIRSATASTSRSLWVMKMIDLPWSTRLRTTAKKSSTSPGVSTAVGSSRIRMSARRYSALTSSTRCCSPTERSPTLASGSTSRPYRSPICADLAAGAAHVEEPVLGELAAEHDVLGDGEHRDQLEVLVDHADAVGDRVLHALALDLLPADVHRAGVGPVQPEHDVHQRALAGAVLAEQAVDLAVMEGQADVLVGDHAGEGLGDAADLEHGDPLVGVGGGGHVAHLDPAIAAS